MPTARDENPAAVPSIVTVGTSTRASFIAIPAVVMVSTVAHAATAPRVVRVGRARL